MSPATSPVALSAVEPSEFTAKPTSSERIVSMDQFRGYAVAGMFVVNFLGGLLVTHQFLKHNNTHFSWADSIMPAFLFACGFSYRLSVLRKIPQIGLSAVRSSIARRSLALVGLSLVVYGLGGSFKSWEKVDAASVGKFVAELVKADLWEVLAIIGVVQLLLLPVIQRSSRTRLILAVCLSMGHIVLSWWFNYGFVYGQPNFVDEWLGTSGRRAWDGGCFGLLSWSVLMLAGSLVYDLRSTRSVSRSVVSLLAWGCGLMLLGYAASCLSTLYNVSTENSAVVQPDSSSKFGTSPVLPPGELFKGRDLRSLLAEPPFVVPPPTDVRKWNYWMMDKRVVTQSFVWFSTGFTCIGYAIFVLLSDAGHVKLRLFSMFGQNALVAYVIHHPVAEMVLQIVPDDSPAWWAVTGLAVYFFITWYFVGWYVKWNTNPAPSIARG